MLRAAWMARLLLDSARAPQMPFTPAVELILETPELRPLTSPVEQHVLSAAVQLAGEPAYKKFLANYVDALGRLGADTIINDRVLAVAATRDIENEFETFVDILMGNPEMPSPLPRHVRTSMIASLLDLSPDYFSSRQLQADLSYAAQRDRADRLVALLGVSEPATATLGAQNALAVDLVLGLTENRRATLSAIEDSGLLVRTVPERTVGKVESASSVLDDQLRILKSALAWVGTAAQEPIEVVATLAAPTELQIGPGDQWFRLTVTEPMRVELLPPAGVEAAISDPLRKEYWGRSVSEASPALRLAPANYMLLVRASEATDERLTLRAVRPPLSFTSSTSPYRITAPISADYLGATPGEDLWLQVDESLADRRIKIYTETPAGTEPSTFGETDSFLELFGSDLESPVLSDDDGAEGYHASLDFVPSEHSNARLIRVSEFTEAGHAHFTSESRFRLVVEISDQ
jgi:hypothetical protein